MAPIIKFEQLRTCKSYAELKMKLALAGVESFPKKRLFDLAKSEEYRFDWFCLAIVAFLSNGTPLDRMNSTMMLECV